MSEVSLTALVLLPGEDSPFDRVQRVIADCLDLADFAAIPIDYEQAPDALWAAMESAVARASVVIADFSHICDSCMGPDYDLVVAASLARFKFGKPVLVCHHGPVGDALPLGWHAHPDTFAYTPDDDGLGGLRKAINRRLVEVAQAVEQQQGASTPIPAVAAATASASASGSMSDSTASAEAEAGGDGVDKDERLKALFRERFRQSLGGSDEAAPAPAAAAPAPAPASSAPTEAQGVYAKLSADPVVKTKPNPAASAPISLKKTDPEAEAKRARMLELQEKLRRKEEEERAAAQASASPTTTSDDDLGFDLNIDLGGDAPVIVSGKKTEMRISQSDSELPAAKLPARPKSSAANPPPMSDDNLVFGEDDDDEDDIDLDDIDILAEIKREQRREKKKKKVKKIARPRSEVPASTPLARDTGPRTGMGALFDKRTGRSLPLRKSPINIGRVARGNDVIISELQISTSHAKITRDGDSYFIEDLGSSNGTFVNDERVVLRTQLKHGDRIILAKTNEFPMGVREFTFTQETS